MKSPLRFFVGEILPNGEFVFQSGENIVFFEFFNCRIAKLKKMKIKIPRFYTKFKQVARNKERIRHLYIFFNFHIFLLPNLAKSSYGQIIWSTYGKRKEEMKLSLPPKWCKN
jgi:hypothetical protein